MEAWQERLKDACAAIPSAGEQLALVLQELQRLLRASPHLAYPAAFKPGAKVGAWTACLPVAGRPAAAGWCMHPAAAQLPLLPCPGCRMQVLAALRNLGLPALLARRPYLCPPDRLYLQARLVGPAGEQAVQWRVLHVRTNTQAAEQLMPALGKQMAALREATMVRVASAAAAPAGAELPSSAGQLS